MIWVGIDPGKSGAVAWVDGAGLVGFYRMPDTEEGILKVISGLLDPGVDRVMIERVGGYTIRSGPQPASRAFVFGRNYGALLMAVIAAGMEPVEVSPAVWQRGMGIPLAPKGGTSSENRSAHKRDLRAAAQKLFPRSAITLGVADAVLIAEYCRMTRVGEVDAVPKV